MTNFQVSKPNLFQRIKKLYLMAPRLYGMDSSPTSGALPVVSHAHFINLKIQNYYNILQRSGYYQSNITQKGVKELIDSICKYQRPFINRSLYFLLEKSIRNTKINSRYIISEQNDFTRRGSIVIEIEIALSWSSFTEVAFLSVIASLVRSLILRVFSRSTL